MDIIKINLKTTKSSSSVQKSKPSLDDYVEVDSKYLYFFKNTWIKYMDKQEMIVYSGGNLSSVEDGIVVLRNIQGKIMEINTKDYIFYCKNNSEQYKALQEILIEREKLNIEREQFIQEKNKFSREKKEFVKKYLS